MRAARGIASEYSLSYDQLAPTQRLKLLALVRRAARPAPPRPAPPRATAPRAAPRHRAPRRPARRPARRRGGDPSLPGGAGAQI
jgi:hypothetical protein